MKPVMQTTFGEDGNCMAACVASLLEMPLGAVPALNGVLWFVSLEKFLALRGLGLLRVYAEDWGTARLMVLTTLPFIATGMGPRGRRHAFVYVPGGRHHDPHPEGGGLVTWTDCYFFIPLHPEVTT